jgi:hypothetical protein
MQKKNYTTHLRGNNYKICTVVERGILNTLDVIVIENNTF